MGRPRALTPAQEQEVKQWFAAGATVDDAHARAKSRGWTASRSTIGALAPVAEAERAAGVLAPREPMTLAELTAEVDDLRRRQGQTEARLQALQTLPQADLAEVATAAVATAERLSRDPTVDPKVQVMALDKLPDLIRLAGEIREAELEAEEDGLFSATGAP